MLTCNEVRNLFESGGISVAQWSRDRGFPSPLVYRVLRGEAKCKRGLTHSIAVALGIKEKICPEDQKLINGLNSNQ